MRFAGADTPGGTMSFLSGQRARTRGSIRWRTAKLCVGLFAVGLVAMTGLAPVKIASATGSTASVPLGDYAGFVNPSGIARFGSATDTNPTFATDYLDGDHRWSGMDGAGGMGGWWGYRLVLGVPIIPRNSGASLSQGAAGSYNQYFTTLAQNLVRKGASDAILRLGWEFNGSSFPWYAATASDAANFAAFWRHIVTVMRAVPGAAFTFLWNADAARTTSYAQDQAYPGDAYVDYVGVDLYDSCGCLPHTPQSAWNNHLSEQWGLNWLAAFATAHHKPIGIPEWSVTISNTGLGLGDDPYFVDQLAQWIAANNVVFTDIFSHDSNIKYHDITDGHFPNSLGTFRQDFGGFSIATATPLLSASQGVPYSTTLGARGGKPPYKWNKVGKLPRGLKLSKTGVISGTPTKAGTYSFAVRLTDKARPKHHTTKTFSITVH